MTELLLQYQDSEGNISERRISDIAVEDGNALVAFCHLREEKRTFRLDRIQSAIDPATGEVIDDVLVFLGVRPMESAIPSPPRPLTKVQIPSGEELRRLRTQEKAILWRVFHLAVIADLHKKKLFALFGNECFKCKASTPLVVDHHVPMVLGGHLVPGNLVALCRACNNRKHDRSPSEFYSPNELENLAPILEQEHSIFQFRFDCDHWRKDRRGYLLHIGIDTALVDEVLNNPDHRFYIPPPVIHEETSVAITIDLSFLVGGS